MNLASAEAPEQPDRDSLMYGCSSASMGSVKGSECAGEILSAAANMSIFCTGFSTVSAAGAYGELQGKT